MKRECNVSRRGTHYHPRRSRGFCVSRRSTRHPAVACTRTSDVGCRSRG